MVQTGPREEALRRGEREGTRNLRGEGRGGFQAIAHRAQERGARTGSKRPRPRSRESEAGAPPQKVRRDPEGKIIRGRLRAEVAAPGAHGHGGVPELKGLQKTRLDAPPAPPRACGTAAPPRALKSSLTRALGTDSPFPGRAQGPGEHRGRRT